MVLRVAVLDRQGYIPGARPPLRPSAIPASDIPCYRDAIQDGNLYRYAYIHQNANSIGDQNIYSLETFHWTGPLVFVVEC